MASGVKAKLFAMEIDRWRFLTGAFACAAAVTDASRALAAVPYQPASESPEAIQRSLLLAIVPFEDPRLAGLQPLVIAARIAAIFRLSSDAEYRAGLSAFGSLVRQSTGETFSQMPLDRARRVVDAWLTSRSIEQRRFISTVKALAMIAVYSDPAVWPAIGYAGPIQRT